MVADVIDEVKHLDARKYLFWERGKEGYVADYLDSACRFFIRLRCDDAAAGLERVRGVLGDVEMVTYEGAPAGEIAFAVPAVSEKALDGKLSVLADLPIISCIRIASL